jgi:aspartate racemase
LVRSAKVLESAGADFIAIPCVTAHHFHAPLQKRVRIPVLHIVEETVRHIQSRLKGIDRIGLLATSGTIQSGLFQKAFSPSGIEMILPTPKLQRKKVMEAIFGKNGIKNTGPSGKSKRLIFEASRELIRQGARAIIAGCTEIPLVLRDGDLPVPVIDPVAILARAVIEKAQGRSR